MTTQIFIMNPQLFILLLVLDLLIACIVLLKLYPVVEKAMRPAMQLQPAYRAHPPKVLYVDTAKSGSGKAIRDLERLGFVSAEGKLGTYAVLVKLNGNGDPAQRPEYRGSM